MSRAGYGDTPRFRTSVTVLGQDQVDEFRALGVILGRRPHELAADMVLEMILRYREDDNMGPRVRAVAENARRYREEHELFEKAKPRRGGFRVIQGGGR